MWVFEIVGIVVVLSFGLFFLLLLTYYLIVRPVDAAINTGGMPKLTPIPIPTKNRSFLMRVLVWFFEVRKWELSQDWSFRLEGGPEIVIPRGFHFDGASIPRPLWGILGKQVNGFAAIDWVAWLAVKIGGGGVWKKHREASEPPPKPEP
jgi:hypothetical protein